MKTLKLIRNNDDTSAILPSTGVDKEDILYFIEALTAYAVSIGLTGGEIWEAVSCDYEED